MKYHWRIIDERYPDEVFLTSGTFLTLEGGVETSFKGFDSSSSAYEDAEEYHTSRNLSEQHTIEVYEAK